MSTRHAIIASGTALTADVTSDQVCLEDVESAAIRFTITSASSLSATAYLQSSNDASTWVNRTLTSGSGSTAASVSVTTNTTEIFSVSPDEMFWRLFLDYGSGSAVVTAEFVDTVRSR